MRRRFRISYLLLPFLIFATTCCTLFLQRSVLHDQQTAGATATGNPLLLMAVPHVTKSLAELGKMEERNVHVLFFNSVPKCGGEVVVLLLQWLQGWNSYRHVRLKGGRKRKLTRLEQEQLVYQVQDTIKKEAIPLSFDRPVHFVNFTSFDRQSPTFINLLRHPVDKVVNRFAYEYAKRYTLKKQKKGGLTEVELGKAFWKCVQGRHRGCFFEDGREYDLSIPYFCGQEAKCRVLNDEWAFEKAKSNVERYFPVVGILEELNVTLQMFERKIPYFFKGAQALYHKDILQPFHQTTAAKTQVNITSDVKSYLKSILLKEGEFYEWIKSRLFQQLKTEN